MTRSSSTDSHVYWDPYDEALDDDPYPVWKRMRDEAPVYRNDTLDFWALSRFDDIEVAHKDTATFSSARGTVLERMGPESEGSGMMIFVDPPDHTELRALVSRAFTPRRVSAIEDRVRAICAELLDPHVRGTGFDYVQDFATQLPSRVISSLVGLPPEDQEPTRRLVDGMFHIEPGVGMVNDTSATAALELIVYLGDLVTRRAADPQDDLVSALVQAEVTDEDGTRRRLTPDECTSFTLLLYTAGTETVAKLLGNAAVVLAGHPDQRADLVREAEAIPNAVEELLRFEPPSPVNGRWTARDVELHGVVIPKGSKVLLLTGSAGRDERAFADPDRFDIRRSMRHHLTFGYGIHFCIGAALARLEGRIALEETLRRFPEWAVDPAGVERVHTSTVRGYRRVPIRLPISP
ncbi:MAG TPA: cytochrome P450 [Acidimicrobiales bacterium]|nr:cytochrome P450 [Acidimicrobiales bacterium]